MPEYVVIAKTRTRKRGLIWVDQNEKLDGFMDEAAVSASLAPFEAHFVDTAQAFVRRLVAERPSRVSMSTEANKATAHEFFARFTRGDIDGALWTMADDATWSIPGKKDRSPAAGLYSKEKIRRLFHRMVEALKDGLQMTVKSCVAEGDLVALEVESRGDLHNGRLYRQEYHVLIEFRDGRIAAVREYLDTHHAYDVWAAPLGAQESASAAG